VTACFSLTTVVIEYFAAAAAQTALQQAQPIGHHMTKEETSHGTELSGQFRKPDHA